jgi:hypothetical protein
VALSIESEWATTAAFEGAMESTPKPKEATAIMAIRLKNVFFDITFLSFVVDKTFLSTADRGEPLSRDAMHVLLHHILRRVSGRDEEN